MTKEQTNESIPPSDSTPLWDERRTHVLTRLEAKVDRLNEKHAEQGRQIDHLDEKIGKVRGDIIALTESIKAIKWLLAIVVLPILFSLVFSILVAALVRAINL